MKQLHRVLFLGLVCVLLGAFQAEGLAADDPLRWAEPGSVPVECDYEAEANERRLKFGGFYDAFWPGGVVPYEYVSGSNTAVRSVVRSDLVLTIPFDGPSITSAQGFPMSFALFDVVRLQGPTLNSGRDLIIVDAIPDAGNNVWITLKVELLPNSTFSAEDLRGNFISVFTTETVSEQNQARFEDAFSAWEDVAKVDFRPRNGESAYMLVKNSTRNRVTSAGRNPTNGANGLWMDAWSSRSTIVHELGHELGAKHEQQRPDRNTYVSIDTTKVVNGFEGNFDLDNSIVIYPTTIYDFGSIMHYHRNAFLAPGQPSPVITVLQPWTAQWQNVIGTATVPSYWDEKTMSFMYPQSSWRFLHKNTAATTNNGGFLTPYDSFDTAYAAVPTGGRLIVRDPGTYVEPGVYSKRMVIEAPQGGVLLRAN